MLRTTPALNIVLLDFNILNMPDYTRYYVAGAFLTGVALATAYNRQSADSPANLKSQDDQKQQHKLLSRLSKINDLDTLKKTLVELESSLVKGGSASDIKEGIEGCIGNTPLIKIKSLSDYTGCDILVKAEVSVSNLHALFSRLMYMYSSSTGLATALKTVSP
jgi:hypothetical protein